MTRVATLNLPGGTGGFKARLLTNPRRTHAAVTWLNQHGVGLVGMQELSTPSRLVWRLRRRWKLVAAPPNNTGLPVLGTIGNAIAFRRDVWRQTGRMTVLTLTWKTTLHIPSVILTHRATGRVIVAYAVHLPGGYGEQDTREAMLDLIAQDAESRGLPAVLLCDTNDHRTRVLLAGRLEGWRVLGEGVDWICVLAIKATWSAVYVAGVQGVFTDHVCVTADLAT